jgi:iron-sulfur cluster insertion protein
MESDQIEITERAQRQIQNILQEENNPNACIRTFVQGGGCSGFQYGFTIEQTAASDDFEFKVGDFKLLVDAMSMQYLTGSIIDYKEQLSGSNFVIQNPNSTGQCGCGSSFSV